MKIKKYELKKKLLHFLSRMKNRNGPYLKISFILSLSQKTLKSNKEPQGKDQI